MLPENNTPKSSKLSLKNQPGEADKETPPPLPDELSSVAPSDEGKGRRLLPIFLVVGILLVTLIGSVTLVIKPFLASKKDQTETPSTTSKEEATKNLSPLEVDAKKRITRKAPVKPTKTITQLPKNNTTPITPSPLPETIPTATLAVTFPAEKTPSAPLEPQTLSLTEIQQKKDLLAKQEAAALELERQKIDTLLQEKAAKKEALAAQKAKMEEDAKAQQETEKEHAKNAAIATIRKFDIHGVIARGDKSRLIANGEVYELGDIIDEDLGIKWNRIDSDNHRIYFKDKYDITYAKKY